MDDLAENLKDQIPVIDIDRKGLSDNSYMKCHKIIRIIEKYIKYKIRFNDLLITNLELTEEEFINITKPKDLQTFYADNEFLSYDSYQKNNYLILNENILNIPIIEPNQNNFNYFGVKLHKIGDVIQINTPNKIFLNEIHIGEKYLEDYVLEKQFSDGFSIHLHDSYHYYQPLNNNSSGYIILAKLINLNKYEIAAIKIPYGFAITISSCILHSDVTLTGKYLVAYGMTKIQNYTKFYFKDINGDMIRIKLK